MVFIGTGAISAVGRTAQETHEALIAQRSGIRLAKPEDIAQLAQMERITGKPAAEIFTTLYKSGVMALIDTPIEGYGINAKNADNDRFMNLAQIATDEALRESGVLEGDLIHPELQEIFGINIGTGIGGISTIERGMLQMMESPTSPVAVRFKYILSLLPNLGSGNIGNLSHVRGSSASANAACASGGFSLLDIATQIDAGLLEAGIAGGAEASARTLLGTAFDWMGGKRGALTREWSKYVTSDRALQAFGVHRDGFVIGEGAAAQVLMTKTRAESLGLQFTTELLGVVSSACTPTEQAGGSMAGATLRGQSLSIRKALQRANIEPKDVKVAYLHLTGTPDGDKNEAAAIRAVFGENTPILTGNKPYVGHTLGAAFSLSMTEVITAMKNGQMNGLPTGKENIDPEFADLNIAHGAFNLKSGDIVLVNAFGFGGQNVTAIVRMV